MPEAPVRSPRAESSCFTVSFSDKQVSSFVCLTTLVRQPRKAPPRAATCQYSPAVCGFCPRTQCWPQRSHAKQRLLSLRTTPKLLPRDATRFTASSSPTLMPSDASTPALALPDFIDMLSDLSTAGVAVGWHSVFRRKRGKFGSLSRPASLGYLHQG